MQAGIINFSRRLVFLTVKHLDKQVNVASSVYLFYFNQVTRIVHYNSLYHALCLRVCSVGLGGSQLLTSRKKLKDAKRRRTVRTCLLWLVVLDCRHKPRGTCCLAFHYSVAQVRLRDVRTVMDILTRTSSAVMICICVFYCSSFMHMDATPTFAISDRLISRCIMHIFLITVRSGCN